MLIKTKALSICKVRFKLKLCRQATQIGFPVIDYRCAPYVRAMTTAFLARRLRHYLAKYACVIDLAPQFKGADDAFTAVSVDWSRRSRCAIVRSPLVAVRSLRS